MHKKPRYKKISQSGYESICCRACSTPMHPGPNETLEDVYWWTICREVYRYLEVPFSYQDFESSSRTLVCQTNLQQMVGPRQSDLFDCLAIASASIKEAIEKTCILHGTFMTFKTVPLAYGLRKRDEELIEARAKLFPNARTYLLGGCAVDLSRLETETYVCDQCLAAERQWKTKHPRPL